MKRHLEQTALANWKDAKNRMPLLLRGARQVGKTYLVRHFAKESFTNLVEINFEFQPGLCQLFNNLDPMEIVRNINLTLNTHIEMGKTLLFFDEIQDCPQAITALRYFYEKMPELHVIGAGSLLEFALSEKGFKMPVGRVQYLHLQPLSFEEFLTATHEDQMVDYLQQISLREAVSPVVHEKLLKLLREYLLIGGMPAVVNTYLADKTSPEYQNRQTLILQTFRNDFGKYATRAKQVYLQKVFSSAPTMVGKRYKYSHVEADTPSRELKEALFLLCRAGLITRVTAVSAHGLPFLPNENKFKILFLDTGLMQRGCKLDAQIAQADDFLAINSGALAEQFVGQEFLADMDPHEDRGLFFWVRDKKNSQAEVDYLFVYQGEIIPVEVKSGKTGTMKSLKLFMEGHESKIGLRFSGQPLSFCEKILSIPLYAVRQARRLVAELQGGVAS